eukprot:TRINITY_DN320_c0_g1_i1.p1 TRINITY_DN320_c0_g1~~TRINITY_DN320_c0_g1_i1.p1  ORF type:complete len:118 (-),score=22.95 TRINITY_DN320_c0_g1_i1:173-526(-)
MFAVRPRVVVPAKSVAVRRTFVRAEPDSAIADAIKEAEEACKDGTKKGECAAAWDEVEELSAHASHTKAKGYEDPLEKYCESAPDADECRVYEDQTTLERRLSSAVSVNILSGYRLF